MKVGDLVQMRAPTQQRGIIIKLYDRHARKVELWEVLMTDGRHELLWASDMKVISESW